MLVRGSSKRFVHADSVLPCARSWGPPNECRHNLDVIRDSKRFTVIGIPAPLGEGFKWCGGPDH